MSEFMADCGSGIGRVTKNFLLRHFNEVCLCMFLSQSLRCNCNHGRSHAYRYHDIVRPYRVIFSPCSCCCSTHMMIYWQESMHFVLPVKHNSSRSTIFCSFLSVIFIVDVLCLYLPMVCFKLEMGAQVDLVEPVSHFLEAAQENLTECMEVGEDTHKAANFYCVPLQVGFSTSLDHC